MAERLIDNMLDVIVTNYRALDRKVKMLIIGASIITIWMALDTIVIQPYIVSYTELSNGSERIRAESRALGEEIKLLESETGLSSTQKIEDQIVRYREDIATLDEEIRKTAASFVSPSQMAEFVENLLGQTRGIQLVSLVKVPAEEVKGINSTQTGSHEKITGSGEYALYKHNMNFVVRGRYPDLITFLKKLDKLKWQVNWESAKLTAQEHPISILAINIYTLSLDRAWLRI